MSVYLIGSFDVIDQEAYAPYAPGVMPLLQKYGAEVLVADYDAKSLEGQARGVNVVIRFESEEKAMAFYDDPDYKPLKQVRLDTTNNTAYILAQEFAGSKEG